MKAPRGRNRRFDQDALAGSRRVSVVAMNAIEMTASAAPTHVLAQGRAKTYRPARKPPSKARPSPNRPIARVMIGGLAERGAGLLTCAK